MRLLSAIKPTPIPELAEFVLDRLEIVPCGVVESDAACILVRYFNYGQDDVEGDHFFATLTEALMYAEEVYGVSAIEWCVNGTEQSFPNVQEMYKSVLADHFRKLRAQKGDHV